MTLSLRLLTAAALGLCSPVMAQQVPVVVELYTSQGCSSCPPADEILSQLSGRDDVIPIAMHVDYWDYIGWEDPFGEKAHADRQRTYAQKAGRRSIYTPEMLVNGVTDIVGAKPMKLFEAIEKHKQEAPRMTLAAVRKGDALRVEGSAPVTGAAPMEVHVLHVMPSHTTKIQRGENRGKTYEYTNIAHGWKLAGTWNGQGPLDMNLSVSGDDPMVVLIQEANGGPIVAAARVE